MKIEWIYGATDDKAFSEYEKMNGKLFVSLFSLFLIIFILYILHISFFDSMLSYRASMNVKWFDCILYWMAVIFIFVSFVCYFWCPLWKEIYNWTDGNQSINLRQECLKTVWKPINKLSVAELWTTIFWNLISIEY